jgi:hypothetical protein
MGRYGFGTIVQIGDVLVSEDVFTEFFACDYEACKGMCCIVGDCGAPLDEEETALLERDYPAYSQLMSPEGRAAVASKGFFEIDFEGDIVTPLVPGTQECAYTLQEDGSCLCAIERCHLRGGCAFPKPVSCALYPIRIKKLSNGTLALNVHHWDICRDAFEKGKREGVRVFQFLRGPLIRRFGEDFYAQLLAAADFVLSGEES